MELVASEPVYDRASGLSHELLKVRNLKMQLRQEPDRMEMAVFEALHAAEKSAEDARTELRTAIRQELGL